jgi:myo-inositol catabolism protein IolC
VLGRVEEQERVLHWLKIASSVYGFIGFAVGRTTFWNSIADLLAKRITEEEAITQIAHNFKQWIHIFD